MRTEARRQPHLGSDRNPVWEGKRLCLTYRFRGAPSRVLF